MNIFKEEIEANPEQIQRWEDANGNIDSKIERRICAKCRQPAKNKDVVMYVLCKNGEIVWWHKFYSIKSRND